MPQDHRDPAGAKPTATRSVCVFLGASVPNLPWPTELTRQTGHALAAAHWDVVYGGASVGLMGVLADAALEAGSKVVGVIPRSLQEKELAHTGLTTLLLVDSMNERKAEMFRRAEAFLILPGGFGTLDELFEVATFAQLGHHDKPTVLLNAHGFFDGLIDYLDHAVALGLLRPEHRALLQVVDGLPAALSALEEPQSKT